MTVCHGLALKDRRIVRIGGSDAVRFLQNLVTCEVENLPEGQAAFGALLSPQGKILFDFFLLRAGDGFLADVTAAMAEDFVRRLGFYRLRAAVAIEPAADVAVTALWGARPETTDGTTVSDPRRPEMGWRHYGTTPPTFEAGDYRRHRIAVGMPEGGSDFAYGDTFPHEALMDQFRGVDFHKGCFVGQEVVSRMQHRGTARKRIIVAEYDGPAPAPGTQIRAGAMACGKMGSGGEGRGLAMVRLDRARKAMDDGQPIVADRTKLRLSLQPWLGFGWPEVGAQQASQQ